LLKYAPSRQQNHDLREHHFADLRLALKVLAKKIEPKVYKYVFLKELVEISNSFKA